jgi:hypothetical protein
VLTDDIPRRIAALSPAKRALLERWKVGQDLQEGHDRVIRRRPEDEPNRASIGQLRMLRWGQENRERVHALNLYYILQMDGRLDLDLLASALNEIERRHECLRTSFTVGDGEPSVRINPPQESALPIEDLLNMTPSAALEEAIQRGRSLGETALDPGERRLWRAKVFRVAPEIHVLVLVVHHLAFDQWSMGVVLRELAVLYDSSHTGQPSRLPALPVQFADFAYWERRWIEENVLASQMSYWAEKLAGSVPPLRLPGYKRSLPGLKQEGRLPIELGPELSRQISSFARAKNSSVYMVLLTILGMTLSSLTDQHEFVIGNTAANRVYGNADSLIGPFTNRVPMRISVPAGTQFAEVFPRIRQVCIEALANQQLPNSIIAQCSDKEWNNTSLTQMLFSLQNAPLPRLKIGDLNCEPLFVGYGLTDWEIALFLFDAEALSKSAGLSGLIYYNRLCYGEDAMQGLWTVFVKVAARVMSTAGSEF